MAFERMTENVMNISGLPNVVVGQASMLKNTFDKSGKDMKTFINNFLDVLESQIASQSIGASVETVPEKTVQAILTAFESEILNRYTKSETDTLVSTDTNNLIEDFDINLTTGVITITKKDGTTETFDTAIEKVPATFEIVESGSSVFLKITNVDGTSTQTDITELMNVYEFVNSDDIAFTMTGTGNEKKVTANIRNNSIGIEKFSLSVITQFEGYATSASNSANEAKGYAQEAKTSKEQAANSASQATNQANNARSSATSASNSANTATTKANEASTSASLASSKAKTAESYAHGGTGTRDGEDTDNAKYYAQIAKEVAGGDFVTPVEMEAYAQPLGTTPTFETTELSGQEIEVDAPLAMESVLQLSGNSEQDSRSGKNIVDMSLFDTMNVNGSANAYDNVNHTITMNADAMNSAGRYKFITGLTVGKEYTISFDIRGTEGKKAQAGWDVSKTTITLTKDYIRYSKTITATSVNMGISFYSADANSGGLVTGEYLQFANVMVTTDGSIDYEPYGVQPSPDYPSEIRSVKSKSDNLFDINSQAISSSGSSSQTVNGNVIRLTNTADPTPTTFKLWNIIDLTELVGRTIRMKADFVINGNQHVWYAIGLCNQNGTTRTSIASSEVSGKEISFVVPELTDDKKYLAMWLYSSRGGANINSYVEYTNIMVTIDSEIKNYQPYGYVPVEFKVEGKGKNLFNKATAIDGYELVTEGLKSNVDWCVSDYIQIEVGKTYVKNASGNSCIQYNANKEKIETRGFSNNTLTIYNEQVKYIRVNTLIADKDIYQLEEGTVSTEYEPYKAKIVQLPLGDIQLRSTPDGTRDAFARVDGVWNIVGKAPSVIFDGSDDENIIKNQFGTNSYKMPITNKFLNNVDKVLTISNRFTSIAYNDRTMNIANIMYTEQEDNTANFITVKNTNFTTLEEYKTYLASNPAEVIYPVATPTYTTITDQALISALDELEQLILHKGYNYITATSVNGVKAQLDLSIPSTASVTEVVETESSMDMPVLVAVGDGDVKPKIPKENQMTLNPTTGEAKINGEKIATETYVKNATENKADKTYVDEVVEGIVVPNIQASTTDLEAGISELPTGNIHLVYE